MSALGFAACMAFAFVAGWFCCSYFEQLRRDQQAGRVRRIVDAAERDGRVAR